MRLEVHRQAQFVKHLSPRLTKDADACRSEMLKAELLGNAAKAEYERERLSRIYNIAWGEFLRASLKARNQARVR